MDSVYPLLRAADVLVFATPLHFYSWSAPLKTLVDRLYCLSPSRKRNLRGKTSVLLAAAADDRPAAFAGLKATYRLIAEFMGWKPLGEVLAPGVSAEGEIARGSRGAGRRRRFIFCGDACQWQRREERGKDERGNAPSHIPCLPVAAH